MSDLVAFIEARLAEDELWALAASQPYRYAAEGSTAPTGGVHWTWVSGDNWDPLTVDPVVDEYVGESAGGSYVNLASVEQWPGRPWTMNDGSTLPNDRLMRATVAGSMEEVHAAPAGHIARHDPARVLREVEAKRRTLARHYRDDRGACVGCGWSGDLDEPRTDVHEECPELLDMALPWSDHPDYLPEWPPENVVPTD